MVKKITVPEIELSHWIGPNKSSRQILIDNSSIKQVRRNCQSVTCPEEAAAG